MHNQHLLSKIMHSKEREQKMHQLLMMFIEQVKEVPLFLKQFWEESSHNEIVQPIAVPASHKMIMGQF